MYLKLIFVVCFFWKILLFADFSYHIFKDVNGNKLSEGYLVNNQPEGFWKSYHHNGKLKSQGSRKNFLLDSIWSFYNEAGTMVHQITYQVGKKQGKEFFYFNDGTIFKEANYLDNLLHDTLWVFNLDNSLVSIEVYSKGKLIGDAYYFEDGIIKTITTYDFGRLIKSKKINQLDDKGFKQGLWEIYDFSFLLQSSCTYLNDLLHGYCKEYDKGNLVDINKYINGHVALPEESKEVQMYKIKEVFDYNGNLIQKGAVDDEGKKLGSHLFYSGSTQSKHIYQNDILLQKGTINSFNQNDGYWEEFYLDGAIKAKGNFKNDLKDSLWFYYYPNEVIAQKIWYKNGKATGESNWYHDDGKLFVCLYYTEGYLNGLYTQFNDSMEVVVKGVYIDGLKDGEWLLSVNDFKTTVFYNLGERIGEWKSFDTQDNLVFKGSYKYNLPYGTHVYYYPNGRVKKEENYANGLKHGEWNFYKVDGFLYLTVKFFNGIETHYNNYKISPVNQLSSSHD